MHAVTGRGSARPLGPFPLGASPRVSVAEPRVAEHPLLSPSCVFFLYCPLPPTIRDRGACVSPSPPPGLNAEVHPGYCGVSAGVSCGIWWVKEAAQTTIPRMPWGPIKVSRYSPLGGGGGGAAAGCGSDCCSPPGPEGEEAPGGEGERQRRRHQRKGSSTVCSRASGGPAHPRCCRTTTRTASRKLGTRKRRNWMKRKMTTTKMTGRVRAGPRWRGDTRVLPMGDRLFVCRRGGGGGRRG